MGLQSPIRPARPRPLKGLTKALIKAMGLGLNEARSRGSHEAKKPKIIKALMAFAGQTPGATTTGGHQTKTITTMMPTRQVSMEV